MQTYRFDLPQLSAPVGIAVEATSVHYVRGNARGWSNAILVSADATSQRVRMVPGQKLRFNAPVKQLYIENADGEAGIVGELVAGLADFQDSRVIGNLTVSERELASAIEGKNFYMQRSALITASGAGNVAIFGLRNHEDSGVILVVKRLVVSLKNDAIGLLRQGYSFQRDVAFPATDTWTAWSSWPQGTNARLYDNATWSSLISASKARMLVTVSTDPYVHNSEDLYFRQSLVLDRFPRVVEPGRGLAWIVMSQTIATTACIEVEWTELAESDVEFI